MWKKITIVTSVSVLLFIIIASMVVYANQTKPGGDEEKNGFWRSVSWMIGWFYFFAWSLSFYPQLFENHKHQSTEGLSFNFVWLNLLGFISYSIFNCAFYFSDSLQVSYANKYDGKHNLVQLNDVFFAVHASLITSITLFQMYCCGLKRRDGINTWYSVRIFLACAILLAVSYLIGVYMHGNPVWEKGSDENFWTMLEWLYAISYIKLVISFIKYCPQVYHNYQRKSTVGWSLHNVLLDFTGGLLSFVQLFLDATLSHKWKDIVDNPVKLGLSILSLVFDIIFLVQHYVLYPDAYAQVDVETSSEDDMPLMA